MSATQDTIARFRPTPHGCLFVTVACLMALAIGWKAWTLILDYYITEWHRSHDCICVKKGDK